MQEHATQNWLGETVSRWWSETDQGRKLTWAVDEVAARAKIEAKGLRVISIRPAGSSLTDR